MNSKLTVIAAIAALSVAALPAASQENLSVLTLDCYRPAQGYGACFIESVSGPIEEQNIAEAVRFDWQNGEAGGLQWSGGEEMPKVWSSRENRWLTATTWGFCADNKCLHFSEPILSWESQNIRTESVNCLHPVLGEDMCRIEFVYGTTGLRVHWPDNSIDHFNISNENNITVWNNRQDNWVAPNSTGLCANRECLLFDANVISFRFL
jgi:hypothetical protein